jgi:CDP-glycerol glycerophosphotransferase
LFANTPNISDVTLYPDMQELLLIADVLVTDYSTIIYDEVIMDKLVLLYAPDLDDYKTNRGLKQIYFDLPTRICQTSDDLCNYIDEIDVGQYHAELRRFLDSIKVFDDGHASERVVKRIASIITKD